MSIWFYEVRKLLRAPAMLVLLAVCLLFNVLFCLSGVRDYDAYVGNAAKEYGIRIDDAFHQALAERSEHENTQNWHFLEDLRWETENTGNVYENFSAISIAESEIETFQITGLPAKLLLEKCARLQASVDAKAKTGEALDLYYAGYTQSAHARLTELWKLLASEGAILGALMTLYLVGYENNNRMELLVLSTRHGRGLLWKKLTASLVCVLLGFVFLWFATMAVYLAFHPSLANIWHSSVSSDFNFIYDYACYHPYITWGSFSVLSYAFAQLGISAGLAICFALMGFVFGLYVKNTYLAFFGLLITAVGLLFLPIVLFRALGSGWIGTYILFYNPVMLWHMQSLWFTDGMQYYLWPNFETWGACISLMVFAALSAIGFLQFHRRDII